MTNNTGLDIFISASLKYPELNTIKYQANRELIIFEIALKGKITAQQKSIFERKITDCLNLFYKMKNLQAVSLEWRFKDSSEITLLRFYRDVNSLSEEEIELLVLLLREHFDDLLVRDNNSIIAEDSLKRQLKKNLLKKVGNKNATNFFAYREEGKVFVYNK
jgi:hypothetical protein